MVSALGIQVRSCGRSCATTRVVVAGVTDPDVVRWAASVPTEAGTAYRKAAAVAALEERRRVVARLWGLGATVVDAPPGALAPGVGDAYLNLKAIGRL